MVPFQHPTKSEGNRIEAAASDFRSESRALALCCAKTAVDRAAISEIASTSFSARNWFCRFFKTLPTRPQRVR
jgi:hypothetical protein